jgi:hypothetical protein
LEQKEGKKYGKEGKGGRKPFNFPLFLAQFCLKKGRKRAKMEPERQVFTEKGAGKDEHGGFNKSKAGTEP